MYRGGYGGVHGSGSGGAYGMGMTVVNPFGFGAPPSPYPPRFWISL